MGNLNQIKGITRITTVIEKGLSKQEDVLLRVQDCYLGYLELTIHYTEVQQMCVPPLAQAILDVLQRGTTNKVSALADLFCVDVALVFQILQKLQSTHSIFLSEGEYIKIEQVKDPRVDIYSQSVIINPQMLKKVDFEPDYSISSESIVLSTVELKTKDILRFFPFIEEKQIEHCFSHHVAGSHLFRATIYNKIEKVQRVVLYSEDGQQLYEVERVEVDLTNVLMEQQKPNSIISYHEGLRALDPEISWIIALKVVVPKEVFALVEQVKAPILILLDETVSTEQLKTLDSFEKRSKGLLTVIQAKHDFDLFCLSDRKVLQSIAEQQIALYLDSLFIQSKKKKIYRLLVELAKSSTSHEALKTFIYLVEQQTEQKTLQEICCDFSTTGSSDELIHRGKILENHGYKELAKEVYDLGIRAHAQEVNL